MKITEAVVKPGNRHVIQKSIAEKKFPTQWKHAELKSIFIKGGEWNKQNY